jgi:hypothetical protein
MLANELAEAIEQALRRSRLTASVSATRIWAPRTTEETLDGPTTDARVLLATRDVYVWVTEHTETFNDHLLPLSPLQRF